MSEKDILRALPDLDDAALRSIITRARHILTDMDGERALHRAKKAAAEAVERIHHRTWAQEMPPRQDACRQPST